jgi:signal peptidase I
MRRFRVDDHSMEPALLPGDTIVCRKARGPMKRGTMVVFTHPASALTMVKRVVGLPGETVTIDFGDVLIDGNTGLDVWGTSSTFPEGEWVMSEHDVFVLSDNRTATRDDSRSFGALPLKGMRAVIRHVRIGKSRTPLG